MSSASGEHTGVINIQSMDDDALIELLQKICAEISARHDLQIPAPMRKAIEEAVGEIRSGQPLYRDPENPFNTWRGSGRRPQWFRQALDKGYTIEQLKVS